MTLEPDNPMLEGVDVIAYEQEVLRIVKLQIASPIPPGKHRVAIRRAELWGEYPRTRVRCYRGDEPPSQARGGRIWGDEFITPDGKLDSPRRVAGDIIMWAEGG